MFYKIEEHIVVSSKTLRFMDHILILDELNIRLNAVAMITKNVK